MASFLSLALLASFSVLALCGDELLFVFEYSVPGASYPKQELFDWAFNKSMQLSSAGIRQHYILGRELRKRYVDDTNLLDDNYNPTQLYVRAAVIDRAISSAYSQLSGLYVAGTGHVIKSDVVRDKTVPPNPADYFNWIADLGTGALN